MREGAGRVTDAFWHRQIPVDSLCLYRVGFGILLFAEVSSWLPYTAELFSSAGFHLGFLAHLAPPPPIAFGLCLLLAVSTVCVALGCYTRPALAITLILWSFFYGLDQINEKAISTIAIIVMILLLLSECGARYSFDDWVRQRRGLPRRPARACAFPLRLLQLEFAQAYFFSGVTKMMNPEWVNGIVFDRTLTSRWASALGVWLSGHLPLLAIRIGGLGTILYELLAGVLFFVPRTRPWAIAAGVAFHLGIEATTTIGTLGLHFIWALLVLYPDPETIARTLRSWVARIQKHTRLAT